MKMPVLCGTGCRRTMMVILSSLILGADGSFQSASPVRYDDGIRQNKGNSLFSRSSTSSSSQLNGMHRLFTKNRKTRWPRLSSPPQQGGRTTHPQEPSAVVVNMDDYDCNEAHVVPKSRLQLSSSSSSSSLVDQTQRRRIINWEVDDFDDHPTMRPGRPRHSRFTKVSYTDAGTLQILFPATGFDSSSLMGSAFSVAWFTAVVPATFLTSVGTALFMVPFWVAGGLVAKSSLMDPCTATWVEIGEYAWCIRRTVAGRTVWHKWGATREIDRAEYYVSLYRDHEPAQYDLILHGPNVKFGIVAGMSPSELERLEGTINEHLDRINNTKQAKKSTNEEGLAPFTT